jgi:hypothetical protein
MRPQVEIRNHRLGDGRQDTLKIKRQTIRCVFANIFSYFNLSFHSINLLYSEESFFITALDLILEFMQGGRVRDFLLGSVVFSPLQGLRLHHRHIFAPFVSCFVTFSLWLCRRKWIFLFKDMWAQ